MSNIYILPTVLHDLRKIKALQEATDKIAMIQPDGKTVVLIEEEEYAKIVVDQLCDLLPGKHLV